MRCNLCASCLIFFCWLCVSNVRASFPPVSLVDRPQTYPHTHRSTIKYVKRCTPVIVSALKPGIAQQEMLSIYNIIFLCEHKRRKTHTHTQKCAAIILMNIVINPSKSATDGRDLRWQSSGRSSSSCNARNNKLNKTHASCNFKCYYDQSVCIYIYIFFLSLFRCVFPRPDMTVHVHIAAPR